ncbi:MAG: phosphohistidine phosphatase SixA [Sedimenticola sp.]
MKLYLVQHGEALAKDVDPDRALSDRGKRDIQQIATFLKQTNIRVGCVFHSGKTRACQTAEILATALYSAGTVETLEGINPKDDPAPLLEQALSWETDTLVVGHLPYMSRAVSLFLTGDKACEAVSYRPGSLVCMERTEDGEWLLDWMIRPELFHD